MVFVEHDIPLYGQERLPILKTAALY